MGGGGGGSLSALTRNWKTGLAFASSGLSTVFPNVIGDSDAKQALDPLNFTGMNTPEVADMNTPEVAELPKPKTVTTTTTTRDLDEEARLASEAEADRLKKRKGYKSTVLTGMGGDLSAPSTLKQTLGGA